MDMQTYLCWADVKLFCEKQGLRLPTPHTAFELTELMEMIPNSNHWISIPIGYRQSYPLGLSVNIYTDESSPDDWSWGDEVELTENEAYAVEHLICEKDGTDFTYLWRSECASVNHNGFEAYYCGDSGCGCDMTSIYDYGVCSDKITAIARKYFILPIV